MPLLVKEKIPAAPRLAVRGALDALTPADEASLFDRGRASDPEVARAVAGIVADVRARGDAALHELARRFDGVALDALEVPREACDAALAALDADVRAALELAAERIAAFHRAQLPPPLEVELGDGIRLGRRAEPLRRVGVYAPGGRAAYPSSVLMGVVPARVAGVGEVAVCSPPGEDGRPPAAVLAACAIAGADRVFALGGAGAVAALAYGTTTVPRVDRIVGPGNAYVTEAKRQVTDAVAIDSPAGPSEVLIVADGTADPRLAALELVAQAEHDPDAAAVLVTTSGDVADAVARALAALVPAQPRRAIVEAALAARGAILSAGTLDDALAFAERYAPEHLVLLVERPRDALDRVRAAGTVFLGPASSVAFGDYLTGANHVLPTNGLARAYSGLSVLDFLRFTTVQELTSDAAATLAAPTVALAEAEGLPGHAAAAAARGARASGAPSAGACDPTSTPRQPTTTPTAGSRATPALPLRAAYRAVDLYDPQRRPVAVDLSDNTNRFGAPPAAARALAALGDDALTRYPSVFADGLKEALARLHGVSPENIATGCGSDDVIDSAVRAFCEPGDVVAFPEPTFGMVPLFARMNAARPVAVPLGADFALDPDALRAARGRITYVCRPNNPCGTMFERAAVERLFDGDGIVLLDEAYADYAGDSMADRAIASGRAVVLRTMSKAWGLAGLRIGYAIGPARLVREIEKSRGPYKITAAADAVARAALAEDRAWLDDVVARTVENRDRLVAALTRRGVRVWPSAANFVLVAVPAELSAAAFGAGLRERGVAVRVFPDLPGAGDCVRVSIGPWPMLERFLDALDAVLPETPAPAAGPGTAPRTGTPPAAESAPTAVVPSRRRP
ncbi:MAG TPA: histidinol dehydrogenase [Longimicrobiales bacterium]